jgi:hypothetical protein
LARSDGNMLERNGTIAVTAPAPPTAAVATISRRLPQSTLTSLFIRPTLCMKKLPMR